MRERLQDIPLLVTHFLQATCQRFHKPELKISLAQIQRLQEYDWPGNIRELENRIERQVILSQGDKLNLVEFPTRVNSTVDVPIIDEKYFTETHVKQLQIRTTLEALRKCNGKIYGVDGAACLLGIKPTTLSSRIKKWGLNKFMFVTPG